MQQVETLDELKARNKAEEDAAAKAAADAEKKQAELQEEELQEIEEPDGSEIEENPDPGADDDQEAADEAGGDKDGKVVPLNTLIDVRGKLKAKVKEKDSEIEELRKEIESLKQPAAKPPQNAGKAVAESDDPPDPLDFNSNAEYKSALKSYIARQVQENVSLVKQTDSAKTRQEEELKKQSEAIESHYERAERLVKDSGISADLYRNADLKVKEAVDAVFPGKGEILTEALIAKLGEGSEKVMYFLGRNEDARAKLIAKLTADKTGIDASIYLGQLLADKGKSSASKNSSTAPAPAARAKGGSKSVASAVEMKRNYDSAHKRGDFQAAIDAKLAAKSAGIDTKSW